ncbi:hypothetical protein TNCV_4146331 [Trichonephila clavipes]|nr:hypothetical protein TNCV_4146331 [Trichonephila clavipes]
MTDQRGQLFLDLSLGIKEKQDLIELIWVCVKIKIRSIIFDAIDRFTVRVVNFFKEIVSISPDRLSNSGYFIRGSEVYFSHKPISISGKEIARRIAVKITPSCCLSEKWRIINLLDDIWMHFTRGRMFWEVGGRPQCEKCGCWSSELLTASFHDFGDNFKLQEELSGGSVVVVHEEPHPQMTSTLSYRPEETGGRQREKSLDTRHRRLDDRYRVLPWPEDCTVVVCLHDALYGVYL